MTIRDVAARAGVSPATVSRVFSRPQTVTLETRRRVLVAADELRYAPHPVARSLARGRTGNLGLIVPDTGIHVNNMLGEDDLNPGGREGAPGNRLTSMMAPSVVLESGRPRLVVGSAGSIRLRAAILQIIEDAKQA